MVERTIVTNNLSIQKQVEAVRLATSCVHEIELVTEHGAVDFKSILGVMSLALAANKAIIIIIRCGENDNENAIAVLNEFEKIMC